MDITKAVALLDAHTPGWRARIDLDTLNMGSCTECVLGQLYGHYFDGMKALGLDAGKDHCFEVNCSYQWPELKALWLAEVKR